jgi:hypothetical protein
MYRLLTLIPRSEAREKIRASRRILSIRPPRVIFVTEKGELLLIYPDGRVLLFERNPTSS